MSVQQAFERLCEVEEGEDLLRFEQDGWCIWPLFRAAVATSLAGTPVVPSGAAGRRARKGLHGLLDAPRLLRLPRATYFAKGYASGLLDEVDGRYRDIWLDDALLALGQYCKVDSLNNMAFAPRRGSAAVPSRSTTEPIDLAARLLGRLRPPVDASALARDLSTALARGFGLSVLSEGAIRARLGDFHWRRRLYRRMLDRVGARFVFVADSGEYELVAAAKESGRWVCEFQHGIVDRFHAGYAWTANARSRIARMPVPDRLFLFGDHWRHELDLGAFWGDRLRVVGSPRIDRFRERLVPGTNEAVVVWTSQGIDVERAIAFVRAALGHVPADVPLQIVLKLHPIYDGAREGDAYRAAFAADTRVQISAGTDDPTLFDLLGRARLHISVSSASHFDALALGVPTVVLPLLTHETVLPLVEAGHASLAASPEALAELMVRTPTTIGHDIAAEYFATGSLTRLRRELDLLQGPRGA